MGRDSGDWNRPRKLEDLLVHRRIRTNVAHIIPTRRNFSTTQPRQKLRHLRQAKRNSSVRTQPTVIPRAPLLEFLDLPLCRFGFVVKREMGQTLGWWTLTSGTPDNTCTGLKSGRERRFGVLRRVCRVEVVENCRDAAVQGLETPSECPDANLFGGDVVLEYPIDRMSPCF